MHTYVLIHGSWHGRWCWQKVSTLLAQQGHSVLAPDLPGHGQDKTPIAEISLQGYVDRVLTTIDAQPDPVILVGHSMGGVVITQAAEQRPDKIKTLVYLCAFLPRHGESLFALAQQDPESQIMPNLMPNEAEGWLALPAAVIQPVFYHDCDQADVALAQAAWTVREPMAPVGTPVAISEANFGRIPRVYIQCLQDQALGPGLQKQMYTATPCHQVLSLNSSHSPFFSAPQSLTEHLLAAAQVEMASNLEHAGL
jgi:pimeloyl-ACP methyl ester carboxylesterase